MKFFGIICVILAVASAKPFESEVETRAVKTKSEFAHKLNSITNDALKDYYIVENKIYEKLGHNQTLVQALVDANNLGSTLANALLGSADADNFNRWKCFIRQGLDTAKIFIDIAVGQGVKTADKLQKRLTALAKKVDALNSQIDALATKVANGEVVADPLTIYEVLTPEIMNGILSTLKASCALIMDTLIATAHRLHELIHY